MNSEVADDCAYGGFILYQALYGTFTFRACAEINFQKLSLVAPTPSSM